MWEELVSVLQRLLAVYEEVLTLGQKKHPALCDVAIKDVEKIVRRERILAKKIGKLEEERRAISQNIAKTENITMHNIVDAIASCDEMTGQKLKRIHCELKAVLGEISANKRVTDALTRQSLELMAYKINILSETKVEPTYAGSGQENISATKWLDFKA